MMNEWMDEHLVDVEFAEVLKHGHQLVLGGLFAGCVVVG